MSVPRRTAGGRIGRAAARIALAGASIAAGAAAAPSQAAQLESVPDLAREALAIFEAKCSECHTPGPGNRAAQQWIADVRKPADWVPTFVELDPEAERVDFSAVQLWTTLTEPDPELRMPPAEAEAGALTVQELALIRWWIESGAPVASPDPPAEAEEHGPDIVAGAGERLRAWLGRLHPMVVHFPIGLLLAALLAELAHALWRNPALRAAAHFCVWTGAAGAMCAAVLGWWLAEGVGYSGSMLSTHRWLGVATALAAAALAAATEARRRWGGRRTDHLFRTLLLVSAGLTIAAGWYGAALVWGADHLRW